MSAAAAPERRVLRPRPERAAARPLAPPRAVDPALLELREFFETGSADWRDELAVEYGGHSASTVVTWLHELAKAITGERAVRAAARNGLLTLTEDDFVMQTLTLALEKWERRRPGAASADAMLRALSLACARK